MKKKTWLPLDLKDLYPAEATVAQLFAEAAVSFPEKVALRGDGGEISYTVLLNYAQTLAAALRRLGVGRGSFVGLAMARSESTVGAILGILLTGGAYVPLDVEGSPESLLRQQIQDSGVKLVLVDGGGGSKAAAWDGCATYTAPGIFTALPALPLEVPVNAASAEDPVYVMFTSGSTGTPKGVMVPHRAVVRLVAGQRYLNFSPNETFLLHSPLSFDASTLELWGSLLHGGCLAIAPARAIGVEEYRGILERNEVTTLWMTAAIFHLVADFAPETFRSLRQLIVGGDVVLPKAVRKVKAANPQLEIVNGYGPTENCTFTACYRVPEGIDPEAGLPIGRAIEHTTAYILDENQRPVAEGEAGELVTGGSGVALGYVGRPRETAERFLPDPFAAEPGGRMYRTGDRVRRDASGVLHFLGRLDSEVKISGRRVDLTALEALVSGVPGVWMCMALALHTASGDKELVLAVEMPGAGRDGGREIRRWLTERMPAALLPARIDVRERLPVNNNGKLDRSRIEREMREGAADSQPATGEQEATVDVVRGMWQAVLGRESIGLDENFFDAGGSSLSLIRLHALLNDHYRGRLSLLDMFQATTIGKVSTLLDERAQGDLASCSAR